MAFWDCVLVALVVSAYSVALVLIDPLTRIADWCGTRSAKVCDGHLEWKYYGRDGSEIPEAEALQRIAEIERGGPGYVREVLQ